MKPSELAIIGEFNARTGKRLGLILTEHVQLTDNAVYFDTINISADDPKDHGVSSQLPPDTARERFVSNIESLELCRNVYTLGDYPDCGFLAAFGIQIEPCKIPFPPLRSPRRTSRPMRERSRDFVFTGSSTQLRRDIVERLGDRFSVAAAAETTGERVRAALYRDTRFVLNIPQTANWRWSSPMRMLAALAYGRVPLSVLTIPRSEIDRFAFHAIGPDMIEGIAAILNDHDEAIEHRFVAEYDAWAAESPGWTALRRDLTGWAIEEGLS